MNQDNNILTKPTTDSPASTPEDRLAFLRWLCFRGYKKMVLPSIINDTEKQKEYVDRIEYELGVISNMGFVDYFLIVQDYVNYAKRQGMLTGPGRGCLLPCTQIETTRGSVSLQNIVPGDRVFDISGSARAVVNVFSYNINEDVIKIRPSYGDAITMTTDHKVLVIRGFNNSFRNPEWLLAENINIGDWVIQPIPKNLESYIEPEYPNLESNWPNRTWLVDNIEQANNMKSHLYLQGIPSLIKKITDSQYCIIAPPINLDSKKPAQLTWMVFKGNIYLRVIDIERQRYSGQVMDISVDTENEPSYTTTGMLVHNSAAGCLVSYLTGITRVDPIPHGLYFERFLNPDRIELPDIDIDFPQGRRQEVMDYVRERYGADHAAQVATFSYMAARSSIRDAARILGYPPTKGDIIAKMVSDEPKAKIEDNLKDGSELKIAYDSDSEVKHIVDVARKLQGLIRGDSIHACAFIIAPHPIADRMPLQTPRNHQGDSTSAQANMLVQFDGATVESMGYLKMDFLGLGNLDALGHAQDLIEKIHGIRIELEDIPFDDLKTFALLRRAETFGLFQVESEGMQKVLKQVRPTKFSELSDIISLYRPGPIKYIPQYVRGKFDASTIHYLDPRLEDILAPTYGVACIAENSMVATKSGEKYIQDISVGEEVLTEDGTYQVCAGNHYQGIKKTLIIQTNFREDLICTDDHRVLTHDGWVEAGRLTTNHLIKGFMIYKNKQIVVWAQVQSIKEGPVSKVYDLSIDTNHSFVVGGLVVHNCYQEQLMEIAKVIAGFTMAEADILRKAIGKKKADLMQSLKEKFISGCMTNDPTGKPNKQSAELLWELMEAAADYSFNKSHSVAYAFLAYYTAYFKANYPAEFLCAMMSYHKNHAKSAIKLANYITDSRRYAVAVLPPHINRSDVDFDMSAPMEISFGLSALKKVGDKAALFIVQERKNNGPYKNLCDFINRMDFRKVNIGVIEKLAQAGALDNLGWSRLALIEGMDIIKDFIKTMKGGNKFSENQPTFSFFDDIELATIDPPTTEEYENDVLLEMEKEHLGFYLTGHPLEYYEITRRLKTKAIQKDTLRNTSEIEKLENDTPVSVFGVISRAKKHITAKGEPMAFITLSDFGVNQESILGLTPIFYSCDVVVFPKKYKDLGYQLRENNFVLIEGRIKTNTERETNSIIVDNLTLLTKDNELTKNDDYSMVTIVEDIKKDIERDRIKWSDPDYKPQKDIIEIEMSPDNARDFLAVIDRFTGETPAILIVDSHKKNINGIIYNKKMKKLLNILKAKVRIITND